MELEDWQRRVTYDFWRRWFHHRNLEGEPRIIIFVFELWAIFVISSMIVFFNQNCNDFRIVQNLKKRKSCRNKNNSFCSQFPLFVDYFDSVLNNWPSYIFFIDRGQELTNLLLNKKYAKALGLTITLNQPFRALTILKGDFIELTSTKPFNCGKKYLE